MNETRLEQLLLERGLTTHEQLAGLAPESGQTLAERLLAAGLLDREQLERLMAEAARSEGTQTSDGLRAPSAWEERVAPPDDARHRPTETRAPDEGPTPPERRETASGDGSGEGQVEAELGPSDRLRVRPPEGELVIERLLGRGGMGVVYLVRDPRLARRAALKLVRGQGNEGRIQRFRREVSVTARLDHPGIPPVYEAGQTGDGRDYLLLRYVDGRSLAEVLQRQNELRRTRKLRGEHHPIPRELLEALMRVGEALAHAHNRGIVHRDLKPENIMLGPWGEVFLMDWGLARDFREQSDSARPSPPGGPGGTLAPLLGTLGYMPPEQARREEVDARADVFALGAVLGEVLCGRPPFSAEEPLALLEQARRGEVRLPIQVEPTVSPVLNAIAAKALAPERAQRYAGVEELVRDLRAYLEGRKVSVYSYGPAERVRLVVRRHPTRSVAAALLALAIGLAFLASHAAQRAAVAEARADAESHWAELVESSQDEANRLGQAWAALNAVQHWRELAPDEPQAARLQFQAAFTLGDMAMRLRQFSLARQAYLMAVGLGIDDVRARDAADRAREREAEAEEKSRSTVMLLLDELESGGRRGEELDVAFDVLRQASGGVVVAALTERLDLVSERLRQVQRQALLEAATVTPEEEALGERSLPGLDVALAVWEVEGLEGGVVPAQRATLDAAFRRLEARARSAGAPSADWLTLVAARQRAALGDDSLRLARVCLEVLGRLGLRHGALPAVRRYVWFEADAERAAVAARALCRLGQEKVAQAAARYRFGLEGRFAEALHQFTVASERRVPREERPPR